MSGCKVGEIDAYVFGELSAEQAEKVRAHLAECRSCATEAAALRAERALFTARAEREEEGLPSFEEIVARAEANVVPLRRSRLIVMGPSFAVAAAAVIAAVFVTNKDPEYEASPTFDENVTAELLSECSCDESDTFTRGDKACVIERSVERSEAAYGACLMGTPSEEPRFEINECQMSTTVTPAPVRQ